MQPLRHSVVLVGFMGAGKTTVAKRLGELSGCHVVEVDAIIAERAGKSIAEIFRESGETVFRDRETAAIDALAPSPPQIIDVGGGAVLRNAAALKKLGKVIWLRGSEQELWNRVANAKSRPLLDSENPRVVFSERFVEREGIYRAIASHVVNVDGKSPDAVALEILATIL